MVEAMIGRLAASGLTARAALADGWSAAYALARTAARPVVVVPPGESAKAVLGLPIAALRLPGDMVESLNGLVPKAPYHLRIATRTRTSPDLVWSCLQSAGGGIFSLRQFSPRPLAHPTAVRGEMPRAESSAVSWAVASSTEAPRTKLPDRNSTVKVVTTLALTAQAAVADAVRHYEKGGIDRPSRSPVMVPIRLSDQERLDLVAFMESLTGEAARPDR